jgi:hypothetical protein
VDNFSIRERLEQLKKEIKQIQQDDRVYKKKGHRRAPQDIPAHDVRVIRMRKLLDEMNELMKKQTR